MKLIDLDTTSAQVVLKCIRMFEQIIRGIILKGITKSISNFDMRTNKNQTSQAAYMLVLNVLRMETGRHYSRIYYGFAIDQKSK